MSVCDVIDASMIAYDWVASDHQIREINNIHPRYCDWDPALNTR